MNQSRGVGRIFLSVAVLVGCALACWSHAASAACKFGFNPTTGKCNEKLPDLLPAPPVLRLIGLPKDAAVRLVDSGGSVRSVKELGQGRYHVAPGRRRLSISAQGYFEERVELVVAAHGETVKTIALRPKPVLSVVMGDRSTESKVYFDGLFIGNTPVKYVVPEPAGRHVLRVSRPGFQDHIERELEIEEACPEAQVTGYRCYPDQSLIVELRPNPGRVVIGSRVPPEPDELLNVAVMLIGGDSPIHATSGETVEVPPGDYEVQIGLRGGSWTVTGCIPSEKGSACAASKLKVASDQTQLLVPRVFSMKEKQPANAAQLSEQLKDCDRSDLLENCAPSVAEIFERSLPQDPTFLDQIESELRQTCRNEEATVASMACTSLGYVLSHDPRQSKERFAEAYRYYLHECDEGFEEACLGAAWLLRTGKVGNKKDWQAFAAKACKAGDRNRACLYQRVYTSIDPTKYVPLSLPKRPERDNPCLTVTKSGCLLLDVQAGLGNERYHPGTFVWQVEPMAGLGGWFTPHFGAWGTLGLRFRSLEQTNFTSGDVGRIYEVALNEHLDGLYQPFTGLGPVVRVGVHGNVTFNNGSLSGGGECALGWWMRKASVELGALYDDVPTRAVTVDAFGSEHTVRSRDYQLIPFVQMGGRFSL